MRLSETVEGCAAAFLHGGAEGVVRQRVTGARNQREKTVGACSGAD